MRKIFLFLLTGILLASVCSAEKDLGVPEGASAPDFSATTHDGGRVKLSEVYKNGPVVLIFYRGGWCMYCNRQLQELQSRIEEFKKAQATIIAVSVDLQANAAKSVADKGFSFTVVSDPEARLLKSYNVIYQVPGELAKKYKEEYGIDLQAASGRSDHIVAIPAAYVIDRTGKIIYAFANEDYKIRANTDEILEILSSLDK